MSTSFLETWTALSIEFSPFDRGMVLEHSQGCDARSLSLNSRETCLLQGGEIHESEDTMGVKSKLTDEECTHRCRQKSGNEKQRLLQEGSR
jgi:hypothetical protein